MLKNNYFRSLNQEINYKMKKLLLLFLFLNLSASYAQLKKAGAIEEKTFKNEIEKSRAAAPNQIVRCATHEHLKAKQIKGQAATDEEFERWLAPKIEQIKKNRQSGRLPSVIRIPVVVHVIHDGDAVGSGENIANAQVLSQIQVLNNDFRKLAGSPGFGAGVDTTIEFCMAQVDPNGNPTNGIDRRNLGIAAFDEAGVEGNMKPNTIWDPTKYFNMWTARFTGDLDGVLGYAQFPTGSGLAGMPTEDCIAGEASTDGFIASYDTFGSRLIYPGGTYGGTAYDKGRTSTHEIGHMFGLKHIWGDDGCPASGGNVYTNEDFCADTPAAAAANFGCPVGTNSCAAIAGNDMIENYMDYTDDACMSLFTQDQKDRMLAVIMNSPRRDDLLVSTVCSALQSSIQFKRQGCDVRLINADVTEGNGCSYTEYTIPLNINKAPTANAVVTFAIDGTSVANANDFTIMTPSVTFNSGATTDKNLVIRVLNDVYVEPNEDLVINFTVNANGGDAFANPEGNKLKMTILNDDVVATPIVTNTLISEDFEDAPDWTIIDDDGDGNEWGIVNGAAGIGTAPNTIVGKCAFSEKNLTYLGGTGNASPQNYMISPQITIPAGASAANLSYIIAGYGAQAGDYLVYFTTNVSTVANITSGTVLQAASVIGSGASVLNNHNMLALAGQTGYVVFRHKNRTTGGSGLLLLDTVLLTANVTLPVQTAINTATSANNSLKNAGSGSFYDSSVKRIMTDITVNSASDYGCTTVAVTRSQASVGAGAAQYGSSVNVADYAVAKEFTITPATSVSNGNTTIKFYFTAAEITAWETFTGVNRSQLYVVKRDGAAKEIRPLTIGAFGSDVTFSATFTTGITGKYTFARQTSLGVSDFEFENFSLYPNPNNGNFTVKFTSNTDSNIKINVHDLRGRQVFEKSYSNNGAFNQEVTLNNIQSGVYLVSIIDGDKKTVKRIVIE